MDKDPTKSWQYRAIKHTRANQTKIGAFILAMLAQRPRNPPYFEPIGFEINPAGMVLGLRVRRNSIMASGTQRDVVIIGPVQSINDDLNRVCDAIKATDDERKAIFEEFRKNIVKDHRATSDTNKWS